MRSSFGVIGTCLPPPLRNIARQQDRVRLFETGKSFHGTLRMHRAKSYVSLHLAVGIRTTVSNGEVNGHSLLISLT